MEYPKTMNFLDNTSHQPSKFRTIIVSETGATKALRNTDRNNKQDMFKNCASFTDCVNEINKTQVNNAKEPDVEMLMYNLIEYSDNYSKASKSLYQFCRHKPHAPLTDSESIKFKSKFLNTNNKCI